MEPNGQIKVPDGQDKCARWARKKRARWAEFLKAKWAKFKCQMDREFESQTGKDESQTG